MIQPLRYIVTIARYNSLQASYAELEQDWVKQAIRLGILPVTAKLPDASPKPIS
jgi:hypothetical protein